MDSLPILLDQIMHDRGLDLRSYKPAFLQRRLGVRLRARGCPDYAAYARLLEREPQEYQPLLNALTINLTRFFRDPTTFQALEEEYLPQLLQARAQKRQLRIWSAGCAAGEEPYSLAILLREQLGYRIRGWRIEIVATDIDDQVLEKARQGRYTDSSFQRIAPRYQPLVDRHFRRRAAEYHLAERIRSMVTFRRHDLISDPPPIEELDLVLCRNVLIYFDRQQQDRLYHHFHRAMQPQALLVLGKTEILPMAWNRAFPPVNLREHIYRRAQALPLLPATAERGMPNRREKESQ